MRSRAALLLLALLVGAAGAGACAGDHCVRHSDCPEGLVCSMSSCAEPPDAAPADDGGAVGRDAAPPPDTAADAVPTAEDAPTTATDAEDAS